jgi:hypothetical protein
LNTPILGQDAPLQLPCSMNPLLQQTIARAV